MNATFDNALVSFENGLKVTSSARKLIFKVPQGPVVQFPEGVTISPYGQNNEAPVIVVHNHVDVKVDPRGTCMAIAFGLVVIDVQ
jgi:hypothetical protein